MQLERDQELSSGSGNHSVLVLFTETRFCLDPKVDSSGFENAGPWSMLLLDGVPPWKTEASLTTVVVIQYDGLLHPTEPKQSSK